MRIAVGILEKSRRLRTARFSLGIRYSSGPGRRGREEAPSGSYGAPELPMVAAQSRFRLVRKGRHALVPLHCVRSAVRISLARRRATGLRFRFTWPEFGESGQGTNDLRGDMARAERKGSTGKRTNARRDKTSHERHNRIVHCTVTECSIPAATKPESAPPDCNFAS